MPSAAASAEPFVCGGLAACFASTCIHPIDLAKVRLQLFATLNPGLQKPSFPQLISRMVREEGASSVYAGLSAALMRQALYGTARIGLHRKFSNMLAERCKGNVPFWQKTLASMSAGAIAVVIGTPFDVALVRMQADTMRPVEQRRNYKNVFDACTRVAKEEGLGRLYAGLAPNILRGMAMNVGMMACYDQAKEVIMKLTGDSDPKNPRLTTKLASSAIAGFTAAFFSLPFDLLKSRLQDMRKSKTGEVPYKGVVDAAYKIFRTEGPFAFWTGFTAYYGRCAPHAMIILMTIESITQMYRKTFGLAWLAKECRSLRSQWTVLLDFSGSFLFDVFAFVKKSWVFLFVVLRFR